MSTRGLTSYAKDVRAVQWFVCAIPIGGRLWQGISPIAFPPLGADTGTSVFFAVALSGVFAILPWALPLRKIKTALLCCSVLLLLGSAVSYFLLSQRYVVSIPLPDGSKLSVSVGSVRTAFADQYFQGETDSEMLSSRGPYENEVKKLWTEDSIGRARFGLYVSYLATLVLLNFTIGVVAKSGKASG